MTTKKVGFRSRLAQKMLDLSTELGFELEQQKIAEKGEITEKMVTDWMKPYKVFTRLDLPKVDAIAIGINKLLEEIGRTDLYILDPDELWERFGEFNPLGEDEAPEVKTPLLGQFGMDNQEVGFAVPTN